MLASASDFSSSVSSKKPIAEENVIQEEISAVEKVEPSKGRATRICKTPQKKPEAPRATNGYNEELIAFQENALSDMFKTRDEPVKSKEALEKGKRSKPSRKSELKDTQTCE
ncbi:unnamed protein product [Caenorhabditis angaria]|uniref:Uncharacterized protein n=1 Tax=Caenorhabditis angaria TaxID=860376 RepID=A0A9P1N3Z6_9PELO|nr:unnamed protein product [Caenorhabditis angaria]